MKKINLPNLLELGVLSRIRREIIIYVGLLFVSWIVIFLLFPWIFPYLLYPYFGLLSEKSLVFISLEEALMVILRASFYIALAITLPFLVFRLWKTLSSELYDYEKIFFKKIFFISFFLGISGIVIGYFLLTPFLLKTFLYFGENFENNLRIHAFLFFLLKVCLFSVVLFQLPLVLAFFIREGIITEDLYRKKRLYFLGAMYLLAVIFAPTDFFSQILLTLFFSLFLKISFPLARFLR